MANNSLKLFAVLLIASSTLLVLAGSMDVENRCCNRRCQVSTKLIKEIQKKYYECNATKSMCKELSTLFTYTKNKLNGILNKEYKASDNHCSGDNCPEAGGLLTDAAEMYDLAVSHECLFARTCNKIVDLFNETMAQLNPILSSCPNPSCYHKFNYDAIHPSKYKARISVTNPIGVTTHGNDLYVVSYSHRKLHRYNIKQVTSPKLIESTSLTRSYPWYVDTNDGYVYVASYQAVERKPLKGGSFKAIISVGNYGWMKWTRDGKFLIVSDYNSNRIRVYNKQMQKVRDISTSSPPHYGIWLDSNGRLVYPNVKQGKQNQLFRYGLKSGTQHDYRLVDTKTIQGGSVYSGVGLCNGDMILTVGSKLIVVNKDFKTIKTISGFSTVYDLTLGRDGTLYVSDYSASRVLIFSLY